MAKELYLYGNVNDDSALAFVKDLEANKNVDIITRMNTDGGDPDAMYAMANKFMEHTGHKTIIVDGKGYSSGAFLLPYADHVKGTPNSSYLIHRAAYASWYEEIMPQANWDMLNITNKALRGGLESKINVEKFKAITGKTLDDVFSNGSRIDIVLNAEQAKEIELIDEIYNLSAKDKMSIAAYYDVPKADFNPIKEDKPKNEAKKMTIEALKADHPEVYAKVFALGEAKERDRVGAWAAYVEADPVAVAAGIKEGSELTMTAMAEMNIKMFKKTQVNALATESPKAVATEAPVASAQSEDDKKVEAFFNEIMPKI